MNKYDKGMIRNFEAIFGKGKYWFSWMLPHTNPPSSDGRYMNVYDGRHIDVSLFEQSDHVI